MNTFNEFLLCRRFRTFSSFFVLMLPVFLLFSCATTGTGARIQRELEPASLSPEKNEQTGVLAAASGKVVVREPLPEYIMGNGKMDAKMMAEFLINSAAKADGEFVHSLAVFYVKEAAIEGINHDVAFAQMCLETGYLNYGGLVTPQMNNFCGLGAMSAEAPGESFPDALTGVRAHIQHLKAYASADPLKQELVDPRYRYVRLGSSPKITGLAGTWASDKLYAEKINMVLEKLYLFSPENN